MFLEVEKVLFESYMPHSNEGSLFKPHRKEDIHFEIKSPESEYLIINLYFRPYYK